MLIGLVERFQERTHRLWLVHCIQSWVVNVSVDEMMPLFVLHQDHFQFLASLVNQHFDHLRLFHVFIFPKHFAKVAAELPDAGELLKVVLFQNAWQASSDLRCGIQEG